MSSPSPSGFGSPSATSPTTPLHDPRLASRRSSAASVRALGPLSPTLTLSPSSAGVSGGAARSSIPSFWQLSPSSTATLTSIPQSGLSPGESSAGASPRPSLAHSLSRTTGMTMTAAGAALAGSYSAPLPVNASVASQLSMMGSTFLPEDEFSEGATVSINQPVGSLSISPSSRDVCLASRKGLYILDLANLEKAPRFIPQGGTWQIADCQWSPHAQTDNLILSTSSQKLLIWDLTAQKTLSRSIDAHLRAITDINWHPRNPNLMATVSMDSGIRGWDLRVQGSTPLIRLSAWGAAGTQVKWNRKAEHILATAHGTQVLVWDDRYGSVPVATINAHDSKIYGIDWDRRLRHRLVTCSLDKTIKFWNIPSVVSEDDSTVLASEDFSAGEPFTNATINTGYPVWRARNLPWGNGVLALPQRGETALEMFGTDGSNVPIERWEGSSGVVKEFVWRRRGGADPDYEDRNFQLITWSLDRKLRIWPMPKDILERAGYSPGLPIDVDVTRRGAVDRTYSVPPDPLGPKIMNDKPTIPSGIARQRMLQRPAFTSMTRGGKSTRKIGQIEWLSRIVKTRTGVAAAASDSSAAHSRAPSVNGRDSANEGSSRSRSKGPRADSLRQMSHARGLSLTRSSPANAGLGIGIGSESLSDLIPLKDEVLSVHKMFPKSKVNFEKFDLSQRKLTMSLNGPWANGDRYAFIRVHWSFPPNYPYGPEIPTFELERNATVSPITRHRMISTIKEMRAANRQCLVSVTEFLLGYHERTSRRVVDEDSDSDSHIDEAVNVPMLIRTTGATFGPNGQLVCFFPKQTVLPRARSGHSRSPSREDPLSTPLARALSALSRLENPHNKPTMVRYRRHVRTLQQAAMQPMQSRSTLSLYNVSHLVPEPSYELALNYSPRSIDSNLVYALEAKKLDHAEVWAALRALLSDPPPPYSDHPPLSRTAAAHAERFRWEREMERKRMVIDGIFDRLMERMDMQMLALVACCLLEYERSAPPPPEVEEVAQPEPSYFVPRRESAAVPGDSAGTTTTFGGRRSSGATPSTPVSAAGPSSSLRTSGWSQILMNPSSISLRGMALTPRDRTSFDGLPQVQRTPGSYEERSPVQMIPSTPRGESTFTRHGESAFARHGESTFTRHGESTFTRHGESTFTRHGESAFTRHDSHGAITGLPSPRRRGKPFGRSGSMALASPPLPPVPATPTGVPGAPGGPERASSLSSMPDSAGGTSVPRNKVSFGSSSPLRRIFSRPTLAPAPPPRRKRTTCPVHLEFNSEAPPPTLLRQEVLVLAELWKLAYADWLLRVGLVGKRAALLQYSFVSSPEPVHYREQLEFATKCRFCEEAFVPSSDKECRNCGKPRSRPLCAVCNTPVRGLSTTCTLCHHTSHLRCIRPTLELLKHCPECACKCAEGGISARITQVKPEEPTRQVLVEDRERAARNEVGSKRFERSSRFVDLTGGRASSKEREQSEMGAYTSELGLMLDPSHEEEAHSTEDEEDHPPASSLSVHSHSQSIAALQSVEQRDKEAERATPPREAAREGMLARARARALGPEGILPW